MLSQIYHLCIGILFFIKSKNTIRIILPRLITCNGYLITCLLSTLLKQKYLEVHKCPSSQKE